MPWSWRLFTQGVVVPTAPSLASHVICWQSLFHTSHALCTVFCISFSVFCFCTWGSCHPRPRFQVIIFLSLAQRFCILYFIFVFFFFFVVLYFVFTREIAMLSRHYLSGQIYLLSLAQRFTVGSTICHRHHIPGYIQHNDRMDISWYIIFIYQWDMAFISTVQHNKGSTPVKVYSPK